MHAGDSLVMCYHLHVSWIDHGFEPFHFLDSHVVVGFPLDCFMIGAHVPYGCGLSY